MDKHLSRKIFRISTFLFLMVILWSVVGAAGGANQTPAPSPAADPTASQSQPLLASQTRKDKWDGARELIDQGNDRADVYTALSLEQSAGVPAADALADRKAGKKWDQIVAARASGKTLRLSFQSELETSAVDQNEVDKLVAKGHEYKDVLNAASIARDHGLAVEEVLTMKRSEQSWQEIRRNLVAKATADKATPPLTDEKYMKGRDRTATGMTRQSVERYVAEGHTVQDIATAEMLSKSTSISVSDLLAQRKSGKSWSDIMARQRQPVPDKKDRTEGGSQ